MNEYFGDGPAAVDMAVDDGAGEGSNLDRDLDRASQSTLDITDDNNGTGNDDEDNHLHPDEDDRHLHPDEDDHRLDDDDDDDLHHGDDDGDYDGEDDGGSFVPDEDDPAEIPKAEWSEDMVQTTAMQSLGICVNTVARVIVCLACSSVIKPSDLVRHLRRAHKPLSTTPEFCDELVNTYDLHEDPLSSRPGSIITAIYGLPLVSGYFSCNTCGSAYQAEKTARDHVAKSRECNGYERRFVQTYQPTSGRMYFGVNLNPVVDDVSEDPLDPLHYFKTTFTEPLFADIPITPPDSACDTNHFLTLEPWLDLVQGKTGRELNDFVRVREPELRKVVRVCVDRYVQTAVKDLKGVDNEARATIGDYLG